MIERPIATTLRRIVPDALAGLAVFALILVPALGDACVAAPSGVSPPVLAGSFAFSLDDRQSALVLLAGVFGMLVTFNLAFFRHVLRAYALPQRGNGPCDRRSNTGEWP